MRILRIKLSLGEDGLKIFPTLGAFDIVHGVGGSIHFVPKGDADEVLLSFDFPDVDPETVPAVPGVPQ